MSSTRCGERLTRDEAVDQVAQRTRALARRQRSWFRADPRVAWVGDCRAGVVLSYLRARAAA